jgi:hypothetical protein
MSSVFEAPQTGTEVRDIFKQAFGVQLNKFDLVEVAKIAAKLGKIPLERRDKRTLRTIHKWFVTNCAGIYFFLSEIRFIQDDGEIIEPTSDA